MKRNEIIIFAKFHGKRARVDRVTGPRGRATGNTNTVRPRSKVQVKKNTIQNPRTNIMISKSPSYLVVEKSKLRPRKRFRLTVSETRKYSGLLREENRATVRPCLQICRRT